MDLTSLKGIQSAYFKLSERAVLIQVLALKF